MEHGQNIGSGAHINIGTNRVAERVTAGEGEGLVEWSDTDTALYKGAKIIDVAL